MGWPVAATRLMGWILHDFHRFLGRGARLHLNGQPVAYFARQVQYFVLGAANERAMQLGGEFLEVAGAVGHRDFAVAVGPVCKLVKRNRVVAAART